MPCLYPPTCAQWSEKTKLLDCERKRFTFRKVFYYFIEMNTQNICCVTKIALKALVFFKSKAHSIKLQPAEFGIFNETP